MRIESEVIMTRLFSQICFVEEYQICGKNPIKSQFSYYLIGQSWLLTWKEKCYSRNLWTWNFLIKDCDTQTDDAKVWFSHSFGTLFYMRHYCKANWYSTWFHLRLPEYIRLQKSLEFQFPNAWQQLLASLFWVFNSIPDSLIVYVLGWLVWILFCNQTASPVRVSYFQKDFLVSPILLKINKKT